MGWGALAPCCCSPVIKVLCPEVRKMWLQNILQTKATRKPDLVLYTSCRSRLVNEGCFATAASSNSTFEPKLLRLLCFLLSSAMKRMGGVLRAPFQMGLVSDSKVNFNPLFTYKRARSSLQTSLAVLVLSRHSLSSVVLEVCYRRCEDCLFGR